MFWKRKKKMIDIAEMQRKGLIKIPQKDVELETDKEGFVNVGSGGSGISETKTPQSDGFFGFMDNPSSGFNASPKSDFSEETARKLSQLISDLDNKLYKIEQRIELLERKLGVGDSGSTSAIGW